MAISKADAVILRDLAAQIAEIAALPVHEQRQRQWARLNRLEDTRPLVHIFEIPWDEMNFEDELTLRTSERWSRELETQMRRQLYQWRHMQDDQIIEATLWCPYALEDSDFGMESRYDTVAGSGIQSKRYHGQFHGLDDVKKIKMPQVTHDEAETARRLEQLNEVLGDIRPVRPMGISGIWFSPWDRLICWYGVEQAMMDMAIKPELVNAAIERLVDAYLHRLAQWEELNVLTLPSANARTGSGGLACTDELPQPGYNPERITPKDLWGCAGPQIFSEISPEMHWEFSLRHEMRWLQRWGLTYYGCCEQLHHKVDLLRRIPNLRKISVSPRADKRVAGDNIGRDYVASLKPNPAVFAMTTWDPEAARAELVADMEKLRGCVVEIVMKDISTVMGQPQRLWDWARVAREVAEDFA